MQSFRKIHAWAEMKDALSSRINCMKISLFYLHMLYVVGKFLPHIKTELGEL